MCSSQKMKESMFLLFSERLDNFPEPFDYLWKLRISFIYDIFFQFPNYIILNLLSMVSIPAIFINSYWGVRIDTNFSGTTV